METEDYEDLSLEQKILCGFYSAKPYTKGAYPIENLNMPKFATANLDWFWYTLNKFRRYYFFPFSG